jgi:phage baseplate assembly protein gpV
MSLAFASPPQVVLEVDGAALGEADAASLDAVHVHQALSVPTLCELTFSDPPGPLATAAQLPPGTAIVVRLRGIDPPLFEGEVTAVEYVYEPDRGRQVLVRGYDRLHRMRKRQTVRALLDLTPGGLAAQLAGDVGLQVEASEDGPAWSRLVQDRQSDLRLLLEVTEASGLYVSVRGRVLHLLSLAGLDDAVDLTLGDTLFEARIEANGTPSLRGVTATGWDASLAKELEGEATGSRVGRSVDMAVEPEAVGGSGQRDLVEEAAPSEERATAAAQAELDRRGAEEVVFRGVAAGDPRLRPGTAVDIAGVDAPFAGRYVLTEVDHTVDAERGYLAQLSSAPPQRLAERSRAAHAVLGRVLSVDDPDQLGRVQVTLPTLRDVESSWMEVLSVGAGSGKGLVAIPDVDDRVLVLLVQGDPAQGVVLGGLYGEDGPYDNETVMDGSIKRYSLKSRGNQKITLDDDAKSLRLEDDSQGFVELSPKVIRMKDATGSLVEMTENLVRLHSEVDLVIEAPGRSVKIRASSVDFESA